MFWVVAAYIVVCAPCCVAVVGANRDLWLVGAIQVCLRHAPFLRMSFCVLDSGSDEVSEPIDFLLHVFNAGQELIEKLIAHSERSSIFTPRFSRSRRMRSLM